MESLTTIQKASNNSGIVVSGAETAHTTNVTDSDKSGRIIGNNMRINTTDSDTSGRAIGNNDNVDRSDSYMTINDGESVSVERITNCGHTTENSPGITYKQAQSVLAASVCGGTTSFDTSLPEPASNIITPRNMIDRETRNIVNYLQNPTEPPTSALFEPSGYRLWTLLIKGPMSAPRVVVEGYEIRMLFESRIVGQVASSVDQSGQQNVRIILDIQEDFPTVKTMEELRQYSHLECCSVTKAIYDNIGEQFFTKTQTMSGQKVLVIALTADSQLYPAKVVYLDPQLSKVERNRIMHALNGNIEFLSSGDNVVAYNVGVSTNSTTVVHNITADGIYYVVADFINSSNSSQRCRITTTGTTVLDLGTTMVSYYHEYLRTVPFKAEAGTNITLIMSSVSTATIYGVVQVVSVLHIDEAQEFKARQHNRIMHTLNGNTTMEELHADTFVDLDLDLLCGVVPVPRPPSPTIKKLTIQRRVQDSEGNYILQDVNPEDLSAVADNSNELTYTKLEEAEDIFSNSTDSEDFVGGHVYTTTDSEDCTQYWHGRQLHEGSDNQEDCPACEEEEELGKDNVIIGPVMVTNDLYLRSTDNLPLRAFLAPNYYRWLEVDIYVAKDSVLSKHEVLESLPRSVPLGQTDSEKFDPTPKPRGKIVKALNNKKDNWAHVIRRWKNFSADKFQLKFIAAVKYNVMYAKLGKHDNFYKAVLECNDFINSDETVKDLLTRCSKTKSLAELSQTLGICDVPNELMFKLNDSYYSAHVLRCQSKIVTQYKTIAAYWYDAVSEDLKEMDVQPAHPIAHRDLPMKGACDGWDLYLKESANKRAHSLFGNIDSNVDEYNPDGVPTLRSAIDKVRSFNVGLSAKGLEDFITKSYPNIRQYRYFGRLEPTSQIRSSDSNAIPWWRNGNGQQLVQTYFNDNTAGQGVGGTSSPRLYCLITRRFSGSTTGLLLANINESWTPLLSADGGPVRNYAVLNPVLGLPLSLGLVYTSVVAQPLPCSLENWYYRSLYYLQNRLFSEGFGSAEWIYPAQSGMGYPIETSVLATWTGALAYKNINGGNSGGPNDPYFGANKTIKLYTCDPTQLGITNFWVFPAQMYEKFGFSGLIMFIAMLHDFPLYSWGVNNCFTTASHLNNVSSALNNQYQLLASLCIQNRVATTLNILLPTESAVIPANAAAAVTASRVAIPNAYVAALYSTATAAAYNATTMLAEQLDIVTADMWAAWIDYLTSTYGSGPDLQSALYIFSQLACRPILDQCRHETHSAVAWADPNWDNNITVSAHKFNNGRIITGSRHHLHNSGNIEANGTAFKPTYLLDVPMMSWNALAIRMAVRSVKREAALAEFPRTAPEMYAYLDYASMTQRVAYWNFYKTIGTSANAWAMNAYDLEPALYDPTTKVTPYQKLMLKIHQVLFDWIPPQALDGTNCLYRYHLDTFHTNENNAITGWIPGSGLQSNWTVQPFDCGVKMSIRYSELCSTLNNFYLLHCLPQRQFTLPKMKWVITRADYPGQQDVTGVLQGNYANSIPITLKSFNSAAFPQVANEYFQELMTYNSMILAKQNAAGNWGTARNIMAGANNQIFLSAPFVWALAGWQAQSASFATSVDYAGWSMSEIINIAFYTAYNAVLTLIVPQLVAPLYLAIKSGVVEQRQFWYLHGLATDGMGYLLEPQTDQLAGLLEMEDPEFKAKSSDESASKPPSIADHKKESELNDSDASLKG